MKSASAKTPGVLEHALSTKLIASPRREFTLGQIAAKTSNSPERRLEDRPSILPAFYTFSEQAGSAKKSRGTHLLCQNT